MKSLLQVENLKVVFSSGRDLSVTALDGVSISVAAEEMVGILGESGAGKSTLARTITSLLPETARVSGSIRYRGRELLKSDENQLQRVRGAQISLIFQEPGLALHPTLPVGEQIADVVRAHSTCSRRRCHEAAEFALAQVHLEDVGRIYGAYPHQLSGGQRQRICIAQALVSHPSLLIADEPTASLDSPVQAEILALLQDLNQRLGIAILLISHNPGVLARLAQRLIVISSGCIVEQGLPNEVFSRPTHAYTQTLVQCIPRLWA